MHYAGHVSISPDAGFALEADARDFVQERLAHLGETL